MQICFQCEGTGIVMGAQPSTTTAVAANFCDLNVSRGVWPLGLIAGKCPSCLGTKIQNSFGV